MLGGEALAGGARFVLIARRQELVARDVRRRVGDEQCEEDAAGDSRGTVALDQHGAGEG